MKIASRIFTIIGMVLAPITFVVFMIIAIVMLSVQATSPDEATQVLAITYLVMAIVIGLVTIATEIIGAKGLKKLSTATSHSQLIANGVLCLIFVNILSGIFMLCVKDEDLAGNAQVQK